MKLVVLLAFVAPALAYQHFCKCYCLPAQLEPISFVNPLGLCTECTKEYCLTNDVTGNCTELNIVISCYQVELLKDSLVVYLFVGITGLLLTYALYVSFRQVRV